SRPLHPSPPSAALVLTPGPGGTADARLLVDLAVAFAESGMTVLRCDLPFRQARRTGPPSRSSAPMDRAGLAHAVAAVKALGVERVFLGGQSYGGGPARAAGPRGTAPADGGAVVSVFSLLAPRGR